MRSVTTLSISELRESLDGRVFAPQDEGYDEARTVFYGGIDRHPAVIVRAANAGDVSRIVSLANETGLQLAVRSGGHSTAGHSVTEGGIVLDLRDMGALDIDVETHTAWAETGLTAGAYTTAAAAHGLATGFGDTGSVGIGGLTLGGGIGFLVRKHGLTIDDLLAADVVTADGQLLHADAETHPDLFWAIRGGGGNFGVATRFRFRLHEVDTVVGGLLFLPATAGVIDGFMAEAANAPEELSTIANVMPAPPMPFLPEEAHGRLVIFAMLAYAGDVEAGERAVAPFRALATPVADMVRPMRYPEMYMPDQEEYHPTAVGRTGFIDAIEPGQTRAIVDHLEASTSAMSVVQLRALGGAMARVPVDATAFSHRTKPIMATVASMYEQPDDRAASENWVDDLSKVVFRGDPATYVNFLGDEGEERIHDAYSDSTWKRLSAIKRRYDPSNLFRLNQNIPPAEG